MPSHLSNRTARALRPSLFFLLLIAFSFPVSAEEAAGSWIGYVKDAEGKAVSDARVIACGVAGEDSRYFKIEAETTTDEAGTFAFPGLGPRDARGFIRLIYAHKDGYAWGAPPINAASGLGDNVAIVLNPPGVLSGRVVDAEGRGVADARVSPLYLMQTATGGAEQWLIPRGLPFLTATTGDDGAFTLTDLPEGYTAMLDVEAPQGLADYAERVRPKREDRTVPVEGIEIALRPEAIVRGRVLHAESGAPAADIPLNAVRVQGGSWACRTGGDGSFEFRGLPEGSYRFGIWSFSTFDGTVIPDPPLSVKEGQTVEKNLRWEEGTTLIVKTWAGSQGRAQPDCIVEATDANSRFSRATRSGAEGVARLRVSGGRHHVSATNPDGTRMTQSVTVQADLREQEIEFTLPGPKPVVFVMVRDAEGRPAPGAVLTIEGKQVAVADAEGRARIADQLADSYNTPQVVVRDAEGKQAAVFDLPASTGLTVRAELGQTGRIVGVVAGEDGKMLPGAEVSLNVKVEDTLGAIQTVRTWDDGSFRFVGIPAGKTYSLFARADGYGHASRGTAEDEALQPGAGWNVGTIKLPVADRKLKGRVRWASGRPAFGATVYVQSEDVNPGIAKADRQGRFEIDGLLAQTVRLQAHAGNNYTSTTVQPADFENVEIIFFEEYNRRNVLRAGTSAPKLTGVEWVAGSEPKSEGARRVIAFVSIRNAGGRKVMEALNALPEGWSAVCIHDSGSSAQEIRDYLARKGLRLNVARATVEEYEGRYSKPYTDHKVQMVPALILVGADGTIERADLQLEEIEALVKGE
jgi:hypothetical protein